MSQMFGQQQAATRPSYPSFIDLRQFARDLVSGPVRRVDGQLDAFLANRTPLELPPGPVEIGAIRLEAGKGSVAELAADEFIILCDGALTLTQEERTLELVDGASAVLSAGSRFDWHCPASATLLYMRYHGETAGDASLIAVDESAVLEPSGTPAAELLIGETPSCRNHTDYRSTDGEFVCGTWDATPYHRRAMESRQFELMHLLQGAVNVVDDTGVSRTFVKGDIFLVEKGAQWSWESREVVKKVYAIYRPA
ncbi:cupin domain-containing protein [Marinobacterium aestuariivivens]|uniref:Cupin domain-containing protein n=1 Tax=Marinobacterium aestuariivivens TaxID=1698799 RepID=A0ABW2A7R3_9GAMM